MARCAQAKVHASSDSLENPERFASIKILRDRRGCTMLSEIISSNEIRRASKNQGFSFDCE